MSDAATQAAAWHGEAARLRKAGDLEGALTRQRRAVTLWRELDDRARLAHALRHVADMLIEGRRAHEANAAISEVLALYRATPEAPPLDVANALRSAAVHAEAIGDGDGAEGFWQEARRRYAELDALFEHLTGRQGNPGVEEADRRLAALQE